jgi:hypothetical protein
VLDDDDDNSGFPENGGSKFLQNKNSQLLDNIISHPRRPEF